MASVTAPRLSQMQSLSNDRPSELPQRVPNLGVPRKATRNASRASSPPPPTPALPALPVMNGIQFKHPTRRILSPKDHKLFLESSTHDLILAFVFTVSESIRDTPVSAVNKQPLHPTIQALLEILDQTSKVREQCPPSDTGSRFGNPEFRTFASRVTTDAPAWHHSALELPSEGASDEVITYFVNSFGSARRIDYGSGHELNYFVYLLCLHQLGLLPDSTFPQLALIVFPRYLNLVRSLQNSYYLEPAGSHGVWGLDDYHFLPFLFGASQLRNHKFIRPLSIHSDDVIEVYGDEYMYLDMVRAVNASKTVQGLRWHSPMLDDISGVREGWGKIEGGMRKMFIREVLGKLVVMQHFLFGGIVPATDGMTEPDGIDDEAQAHSHEHNEHNETGWGDCCGIRVPSSIGAVQEMRKKMQGESLRRLPFD